VAALAVGGTSAAVAAKNHSLPLIQHQNSSQSDNRSGDGGSVHFAGSGASSASGAAAVKKATRNAGHATTGSQRSASGTAHGFTPTTRESSGARARAFAQTRGNHTGLTRQHKTSHGHTQRVKKVHVRHTPAKPVAKAEPHHVQVAPKAHIPAPKTQTPAPKANAPAAQTPAPTPAPTPEPQAQTEPTVPATSGGQGHGGGSAGTLVGNGKHSVSTTG
jgi:hypothetical protein